MNTTDSHDFQPTRRQARLPRSTRHRADLWPSRPEIFPCLILIVSSSPEFENAGGFFCWDFAICRNNTRMPLLASVSWKLATASRTRFRLEPTLLAACVLFSPLPRHAAYSTRVSHIDRASLTCIIPASAKCPTSIHIVSNSLAEGRSLMLVSCVMVVSILVTTVPGGREPASGNGRSSVSPLRTASPSPRALGYPIQLSFVAVAAMTNRRPAHADGGASQHGAARGSRGSRSHVAAAGRAVSNAGRAKSSASSATADPRSRSCSSPERSPRSPRRSAR
jgi:hypothetical protein